MVINYSHNDIAEEAIHLGNNATVFQAEVFAVGRTASHLIFAETKNKRVVIKVTWDVAERERTKHNIWTQWRDAPPSHFTRVWRKKFSKSIHNLNRGNLREFTCSLQDM